MKTLSDGIRKAAILIASLDQRAADRLLDRFEPEQAQRLRDIVVELFPLDPQEQRRIIDEFFRIGPMVPQQHPPGIELDDRLTKRFLAPSPAGAREPPPAAAANVRPFQFLQEAEADKLARALASERPQTMALVLSHLTPEQAGAVLVRLEAPLQVEVVHRLVDLEETDPAILREVERALEARLSQQVRMQRRRVAGLQAVAGILQASARPVGAQILRNLTLRDRRLAEKLGPAPIAFDDLVEAGDATWAAILESAETELLLLALVGVSPVLLDRILRLLPAGQAEAARARLDHPGPTRLSDVEEARQELAELARRLAIEGRISLPGTSPRFPAGVAA